MIPENKLLSKFVDYLIKNDYSINNLLENFIEMVIVKDEYNVYLDTIKKQMKKNLKVLNDKNNYCKLLLFLSQFNL